MPQQDSQDRSRDQPKYKIAFLNGIFLLAMVLGSAIGLYRLAMAHPLAAIDFLFAGAACALWLYLRHHPGQVERVASIALTIGFLLFLAAYLVAPLQGNRLSLFFLLSAAAFFLKGIRVGLWWLAASSSPSSPAIWPRAPVRIFPAPTWAPRSCIWWPWPASSISMKR
jgi:hypothetical protein